MKWKFWAQRPPVDVQPVVKLPKPGEIPEPVGRHMVVKLNWDPDQAWALMAVSMPQPGSRHRKQIRVFDPTKTALAGIQIKDYHSLDTHRDQIILEGWFDKSDHQVELQPAENRDPTGAGVEVEETV